jgi:uncharacterized protein YheU (UPF0270 family)
MPRRPLESDGDYPREAEAETPAPVVVPHRELAPEVLRAVVESWVLREGTDYGERELPLADKVMRVIRQLERGEAKIVFDPASDTVNIIH